MEKKKAMTFEELQQETSSKDYVPRSSNLTEGNEGEDVERLQSYLASFGYFNDQNITDFFAAGIKVDLPSSPETKGSLIEIR
jgi:peptidoglycan hydrolase-like protein with peptidoglycan-binding domain